MHYYGHPEKGAEIIKERILPALEENGVILSEDEKRRLLYYVTYHDDRMSFRPKHMCQHLQMVSYEEFQKLMLLEVADAKAHTVIPIIADRIEICSQLAGEKGLEIHEQYQELFDECER